MTVRELIEKLKGFDPELPVALYDSEEGYVALTGNGSVTVQNFHIDQSPAVWEIRDGPCVILNWKE